MDMGKVLGQSFFNRPTLRVARELLGKYLVRKIGARAVHISERGRASSKGREISRMITDVEAYVGPHDMASHASRGMTPRNRVMFGKPGCWYVYFTYGMHWMLNIITEREGYPAAILIRGVAAPDGGARSASAEARREPRPLRGREGVSGPARVTRFFKVDKRFNGRPASWRVNLWIEDRGLKVPLHAIHRSKRVGVDYAGAWRGKQWRFYL